MPGRGLCVARGPGCAVARQAVVAQRVQVGAARFASGSISGHLRTQPEALGGEQFRVSQRYCR